MKPDNVPWLNETVLETAREAIYVYAKGGVPGGVYEPFLYHPVWSEANLSMLVCAGSVARHVDSWELPRYAYFLVLINDGWAAKMATEKLLEIPRQTPGKVFRLDIHEEHALVRDRRVRSTCPRDYVPGFAALVMNLYDKLSEAEVRQRFEGAFAKVADQFSGGMPDFYRGV